MPAYGAPPPPPDKPRHTGRNLLIIGLIVVLILALLGAGAVIANASLASIYSPEKAVMDYLAAQQKGDFAFMRANANFLKGDGAYSQYFNVGELDTMMSYPQNTDISNVKVSPPTVVDSTTNAVDVTMTWSGHQLHRHFIVHKDPTRVHDFFYYSWRIDIPFTSIHVQLPNQPGVVSVDALPLPPGATGDIQVIGGFHKVTMTATTLYDAESADADGIESNPSVIFQGTISATARATAATTIKTAFNTCAKPDTYQDCFGRLYNAPNKPGVIYYTTLPGYGDVYYTTYKYTLTRDPTLNMKLSVPSDAGKVNASGACAITMTIDGSRKYYFKGIWAATLTTSSGSWGYDFSTYTCFEKKA